MRTTLLLVLIVGVQAQAFSDEPHVCTAENPAAVASGPDQSFYLAGYVKELWKPGDTIRIRFLGGSSTLQNRIMTAVKQWTDHANINFQYVSAEPADVRISFTPGIGSWSYIGKQCQSIASPNATMNFGWLTDASSDQEVRRVAIHEFGHMLGMIHEH